MNLFQQYGIKEVADVTFYSINRIGDEEFYTPVLYLDTLKVSTLEKKNQISDSYGGYGNQKISSWSFNKSITLKLEDALFSPASMSLLWGGQLESKFSKYTSAIVKINIANKYGKLNYSPQVYASPILTPEEWGVIFNACDSLGKSFIFVEDSHEPQPFNKTYEGYQPGNDGYQPYIEENRVLLQKSYYSRNFTNIFNQSCENWNVDPSTVAWSHSINQENIAIPDCITAEILKMITQLKDLGNIQTTFYDVKVIDRMEKCVVRDKEGLSISTSEQKKNLLKYFLNDKSSSYCIYYDIKTMLPLLTTDDEGNIIGWTDQKLYVPASNENPLYDYTWILDILNHGEWINSLASFAEYQYQAGFTDKLSFIKSIAEAAGRIKLLWGYDNDGLIHVTKNATPYSFKESVKIIHSSDDNTEQKNEGFEPGQVMPEKENVFKLRIGTPYLKWSRTVKAEDSSDTIGRTFIINTDTFPNQYRIIGETYIRNRKGKDERYQFVISRAQVSSDTNITLQAEGDPSVFSMNIDVLNPPNDIMMELRHYDVTEDTLNSGTKIIPQKEDFTKTETIYFPENIEPVENNEIY